MRRVGYFISLLMMLNLSTTAQSRLGLTAGYTISNLRTYYPSTLQPGPTFGDLVDFPPLYRPFVGVSYECDYKQWRFSTGLTLLTIGAGRFVVFEGPWPYSYFTLPITAGRKIAISKDWQLILKGGLELGYQVNYGPVIRGQEHRRFNLNAVFAIEIEWRRLRLGLRMHWGLNEFRTLPPISYYHTAGTLYLGYTLWDHGKAKARRAKKRQERQLSPQ